LKDGWDNPNIFQICTLRETRSTDKKRQEIGRGLRLPVDIHGNQVIDKNINVLTVIANESYREFVSRLQAEYTDEGYRVPPEPSDKRKQVKVTFRKQWAVSNEDFKKLWEKISRKTRYNISLNTDEIIATAVQNIDAQIQSRRLVVRVERVSIDFNDKGKIKTVYENSAVGERLDRERHIGNIVSRIASEVGITRNTVSEILSRVENLDLIFENPEEYIRSVIIIIKEILNTLQVSEGLEYIPTGDVWDVGLFEDFSSFRDRAIESEKSAYDYVVYDSEGEKEFAESLERSSRVTLFTKLPATFLVNTPLGSYNPDWAIVVKQEEGEKLYLVRETKFVDDISNLRPSELFKTLCGKRHFEALNVDYKISTKEDLSDLFT
jgi:type III restriction enzyme